MAKIKSNQTKKIKPKRPTLVEENEALKETIKALQDQNTNLSLSNHELDKQNSILRERLSNFGLRDLVKNLGLLGIGTAMGEVINRQYLIAAGIAIISSLIIEAFSIYDNFSTKIQDKKEKVGI
jgi:hypothetical protein